MPTPGMLMATLLPAQDPAAPAKLVHAADLAVEPSLRRRSSAAAAAGHSSKGAVRLHAKRPAAEGPARQMRRVVKGPGGLASLARTGPIDCAMMGTVRRGPMRRTAMIAAAAATRTATSILCRMTRKMTMMKRRRWRIRRRRSTAIAAVCGCWGGCFTC